MSNLSQNLIRSLLTALIKSCSINSCIYSRIQENKADRFTAGFSADILFLKSKQIYTTKYIRRYTLSSTLSERTGSVVMRYSRKVVYMYLISTKGLILKLTVYRITTSDNTYYVKLICMAWYIRSLYEYTGDILNPYIVHLSQHPINSTLANISRKG